MIYTKDYAGIGTKEPVSGKFVLLEYGDRLHLVLSRVTETPYHFRIVEKYLCEYDARILLGDPDRIDFGDSSWRGRGGGHFEWQPEQRQLLRYGKSYALGPYERDLLEPLRRDILDGFGLGDAQMELG